MPSERVTITLPDDMVADIDRRERNRSRFIREAIRNELARRRREALRRSLLHPHPEGPEIERLGLEEWNSSLPDDGVELLDLDAGTAVRWKPGRGWVEAER